MLSKDHLAGLSFVLVGAVFAVAAGTYGMGRLDRMGPGFFPRILACLLILLGALIFLRAQADSASDEREPVPWRALLALIASLTFFSLLLKIIGLMLASAGLVLLASLALPTRRWRETLLTATLLGLAACGIFVWGLKLPLPVWPGLS